MDPTSSIRIEWVNTETGVGAFATRSFEAGDCVLKEAPWVFAQSYRTWNTSRARAPNEVVPRSKQSPEASPSPPHYVRCCFGCGAPLVAFMEEECDRLDALVGQRRERASESDRVATATPTPKHPSSLSLWELICSAHGCRRASLLPPPPPPVEVAAQRGREENAALTPTIQVDGVAAQAMLGYPPYVVEVDAMGQTHVVYFCSPSCEAHSLGHDGKRYVLTSAPTLNHAARGSAGATVDTRPRDVEAALPLRASGPEGVPPLHPLCYPTAELIVRVAHHPPSASQSLAAWPTRIDVLSTIHAIARRCNERVWFIVLMLSKHLSATLASLRRSRDVGESFATEPRTGSSSSCFLQWIELSVAPTFRNQLEDMQASYAEGAMHLLSIEQRALLRFSSHLIRWWWLLCCAEEFILGSPASCTPWPSGAAAASPLERALGAATPSLPRTDSPFTATLDSSKTMPDGEAPLLWEKLTRLLVVAQTTAFPLQLYLQLYWLTNANVHMYVVTNPLYTIRCQLLHQHMEGSAHTARSPPLPDSTSLDVDRANDAAAAERILLHRLHGIFHECRDRVEGSTPVDDAATSDALHPTGVALYNRAAKLNHSCLPNVCFQPTMGPVAATVVALRPIEAGEEILTSYIRVASFDNLSAASQHGEIISTEVIAAAERRRRYLQEHYGFLCQCPLCAT